MAEEFVDLTDYEIGTEGNLAEPVASPPKGSSGHVGGAASQGGDVSYDASDLVDKLSQWQPRLKSADADLLSEKGILDARSRDMVRNDAFVSGGQALHKDSIVGANFVLNAKPETKILWGKEDPTWETEFQEEVETKFALWAESDQNWPDASRINTLTDLVRLAVGVYVASGEVLASAEWMRDDGRPFRSAIQMIDTDRLSNPWNRANDTRMRRGVEKNYYGEPKAYWIRLAHPSDVPMGVRFDDTNKWRRVPARRPWGRPNILHVFEQMRPDQSRGVSMLSSALTEMRMTRRFRQTELERAIIAATYAASIETELPPGEVYTAMGAGDDSNPTVDWATDYLAAVNEYSGGAKNLHINGSRVPVFWPGTHLKIQNPGAASPAGDKFESSLLRHIAAALGVSYEQFSRDYTDTNYSSARAAMADTWRAMQSKKRKVADRTGSFVYRLWLEEAVNSNQLETLKRPNVPAFYDGLNSDAYANCEWIGAGQGVIDPYKETQADVLAIEAGLETKESVISRRRGGDYRRVTRQRARELELDRRYQVPSIHDPQSSEPVRDDRSSPADEMETSDDQ